MSVLDIKFIKYLKYLKEVSKSYPKPSPLRIITRSTAANLIMPIGADDVLFTEIDTLSKILYEDIKSNKSINKNFMITYFFSIHFYIPNFL